MCGDSHEEGLSLVLLSLRAFNPPILGNEFVPLVFCLSLVVCFPHAFLGAIQSMFNFPNWPSEKIYFIVFVLQTIFILKFQERLLKHFRGKKNEQEKRFAWAFIWICMLRISSDPGTGWDFKVHKKGINWAGAMAAQESWCL